MELAMKTVLRIFLRGLIVATVLAIALFGYFVYSPSPGVPRLSGKLTEGTVQVGALKRTYMTYVPKGLAKGARRYSLRRCCTHSNNPRIHWDTQLQIPVPDLHGQRGTTRGTHAREVGPAGPPPGTRRTGVSRRRSRSSRGQREALGSGPEAREAAEKEEMSGPTPRRLWNFVMRRLQLRDYFEDPGDGRQQPQIPAQALLWALLIGQILQESSFHAVEALARSSARRTLSIATPFCDDTLGYFTERLDPGPTRQALALEAPSRFRVVAAVAANLPTPENFKCKPAEQGTSSVMIMNGMKDPLNPFDGGEVKFFGLFRRGRVRSSRESGQYFAALYHIPSAPQTDQTQPQRFRNFIGRQERRCGGSNIFCTLTECN